MYPKFMTWKLMNSALIRRRRFSVRRSLLSVATICFLLVSPWALAHNPLTGSFQERVAGTLSAVLLMGFWFLYGRGSFRVRPATGKAVAGHLGFALCTLTLLGPLDDLATTSSAAHMLQHMMIMVIITPLWVASQPLPQISAAGGQVLSICWRPLLRLAGYPMACAYLHAAVIWFWHMPWFYMLAVENPWWHTLEHALFLSTAGVFWWSVMRASPVNFPVATMALLFTLMHTGFLGALLSFSQTPIYHEEARSLADQQLAGLIMWVAGAIPYLLASGWITRRWYQRQAS